MFHQELMLSDALHPFLCGLLEYTKLGKIQIKQSNIFASLKLAKVRNETKRLVE